MSREELIELVKEIISPSNKTEKEIDALIDKLEKHVPHPAVSDLIFYDDLTPDQIVDQALSYKPIHL